MLNHDWIGTEHLLLGLIREGDGVAAQILVEGGVRLDPARTQVIRLLHDSSGGQELAAADELVGRLAAIAARLAVIERRLEDTPR